MNHTGLKLVALSIGVFVLAFGQSQTEIDRELALLASPDLQARSDAFYRLVGPMMKNTGDVPIGITNLLWANPAKAENIKAALISALELERAYKEDIEDKGQQLTELFTAYWADMLWAVGSLRDPRAAKALIGGLGTGGIVANALVDIGQAAVDPLIDVSRGPERYFRGTSLRRRGSAIQMIGSILIQSGRVRSDSSLVAKARAAILAGLEDSDPVVRQASAYALLYFREEPAVRARLEFVAGSDPYVSPTPRTRPGESQFPVRDAAASVLRTEESQFFYVVREPVTQSCGIEQGGHASDAFLGPFFLYNDAAHAMCRHYNRGSDSITCLAATPSTACGQ